MEQLFSLLTFADLWPTVLRVLVAMPFVGDVLLHTALFLWCFWALYVLVMGLYRVHLDGRMSRTTYALALPWVLLGLVVDVFANVFVATIVFLEIPREWLVTDRLQRHIRTPTSVWRTRLATWVCDHLLDVFDPTGDHC